MYLLKQTGILLRERKAQVLLPSVLLIPLFILVIYLLFDLTNLSMTKVQHQFALDNAAYTQLSSVSTYLNAMAMINGPTLYRVMIGYSDDKVPLVQTGNESGYEPEISVFDLFYRSGFFPSMGPDHKLGLNKGKPKAESTDWDFQYYPADARSGKRNEYPKSRAESSSYNFTGVYDGHKDWATTNPVKQEGNIPFMDWDIVTHYQWQQDKLLSYIMQFLNFAFMQGSIYQTQNYMFRNSIKNAAVFREGYAVNILGCKPSECAKESARVLAQQLQLNTVPFELSDVVLFISNFSGGSQGWDNSGRAFEMKSSEILDGKDLYVFNYFDNASYSKLKVWERGVTLKQSFKTPSNNFRKNLDQKYKPFTRVTVTMSCPRRGNNCVWPNPLPKYNVVLRP